jgi:SAM-dependent methyltransferase
MSDTIDFYLQAREKEGRLYSDDLIAQLPSVPTSHPLYTEWRARTESAGRLRNYLQSMRKPRTILELGCGNGWLTNYLAQDPHTFVWGIDRNQVELVQAARVFGDNRQLGFAHADIFNPPFINDRIVKGQFDTVVLASVIQYFPDLPTLIFQLLTLLKPAGEIHVIDSPLYAHNEVEAAKRRSQAYYEKLGVPEMAGFYYHHTWEELLTLFDSEIVYNPNAPLEWLMRKAGLRRSVFPWIRIRARV